MNHALWLISQYTIYCSMVTFFPWTQFFKLKMPLKRKEVLKHKNWKMAKSNGNKFFFHFYGFLTINFETFFQFFFFTKFHNFINFRQKWFLKEQNRSWRKWNERKPWNCMFLIKITESCAKTSCPLALMEYISTDLLVFDYSK